MREIPTSPPLTRESPLLHRVPDGHHPSSDDASRPLAKNNDVHGGLESGGTTQLASPPRGLWQWARAGSLLGKLPHAPYVPLSRPSLTPSEDPHPTTITSPKDDFSVPSAVATDALDPDPARMEHLAAAKITGVGIANRSVEGRTGFTQTKRSSDEIVEMMGTPSPGEARNRNEEEGGKKDEEQGTPSRAPRRKDGGEGGENGVMNEEGEGRVEEVKASPRRVPKYKIALAANVLSPRRGMGATSVA